MARVSVGRRPDGRGTPVGAVALLATPSVIYSTYEGGVGGVLALVDVFALVTAITVLGVVAVRARRRLKVP